MGEHAGHTTAAAALTGGGGWPDLLGPAWTHGTVTRMVSQQVRLAYPPGPRAVPPDALTCAVFAVVCCRHAGRPDLVIGSGADRHIAVALDADPTVAELAAAISAQRGAVPPPGAAAPAIWHDHDPAPGSPQAPDTARLRGRFALSDGVLTITIHYDEQVLAGPVVSVLLDHVAEAVRQAAADPGLRCAALRLAGDDERRRIAGWCGTAAPAEPPRPVHELVSAQAARRPQAVAVTGQGRRLTYRELDDAADAVAGALADHVPAGDSVVLVLAGRSVDLVVILLGILKAGAAYLVVDPQDAPAAWLAVMVRDAGPALLVYEHGHPPAGPPALRLADLLAGAVTKPAGRRTRPAVDVRQLAYVSYTSGTTGVAKGVAVSHEAVARLVRGPDWAELTPDDVFLQLSAIAFDASTLELWGPLANGGRLVVHPAGLVAVDELAELVRRERITHAWFTAGLFHQLVDAHLDAFGGLRHVFAGGDVVSAAHLRRLRAAHPRLRFTNGYGPTENTTFTTCWPAPAGFDGPVVPIGRPIRGTRVAILSDRLEPVPVGVPGDLYAGGSGLARGYLGRPGETAAVFVPDPAPHLPGARLYRTGDLARWRPDGDIEFLGRSDTQVKVRGYRAEPLQLAALLEQQPGVQQAVVAEAGEYGAQRLVGYVVLAGGPAVDELAAAAALRDRLAALLPSYLVPAQIVALAELPLTPNGKVDRSRLGRGPRTLPGDYAAPRRPVEARLATIWSEVLGVAPVGVHDNFFDLGGNSLVMSQLILEMEKSMGCRIPARTVFQRATIAGIAEAITGLQDGGPLPDRTREPD